MWCSDEQAQLNIINFLYTDMINVFVTIGEFDIRTSVGARYVTEDPSRTIEGRRSSELFKCCAFC